MRRHALIALALLAGALAPVQARAATCGDAVETYLLETILMLDNGCIAWSWHQGATTHEVKDHRTGLTIRGPKADFSLVLGGVPVPSSELPVAAREVDNFPDGVRVTWRLLLPDVAEVTRTVEMYRGIAGIAARTTITSLAPLALSGYSLQEISALATDRNPVASTIHSMRAGGDWRDEAGWEPQLAIGDAHTGTWRSEQKVQWPTVNEGTGQWLSVDFEPGRVALVMERRDYASSRMSVDFETMRASVDLSRDVVYTGPFESDIHAENPGPGPARHRIVVPGRPLELEPVFVGFGTDADDEVWQFHKYLTEHRLTPYRRDVVFNTNRIDSGALSDGAKDDVDFARFETLVPAAREMGVDVFVLDDGWQARSGDWCPDAATGPAEECTDARWDGTEATARYKPRFPDHEFAAVRERLAGDPDTTADDIMLGLWMSPMAFHPRSKAFLTNPQWSCLPVGTATGAVSIADPNSGSFDAGIGLWNPLAMGVDPDDVLTPMRNIDYIEKRIARAIEVYGARYFKFDFLVWVDCGGVEPVTMYEYRDAFVGMLDRLQAAHPEVTIEIDETNDYRMFPYESVARGPSWFLNGSPTTVDQLHALWTLAPFVPGFSIGQAAASNGLDLRGREPTPPSDPGVPAKGVNKTMAVGLTSHLSMWQVIDTGLTASERAQFKKWTDFYAAHSSELGTFAFPLLGDPSAKGWTALQPWNLDTRSGWLLAYRQESPEATRAIGLRGLAGVPAEAEFTLTAFDPGAGVEVNLGTRTADELRVGIDVTISDPWYGYALIRIEPV